MKSKNKRKDFYKMNSRKHNRWYSILLSLFLLFSLTGCNENLQTETNQTTDEAVVVSQEAEDTEEPEVEKNTEDPDQSEIESQDEEIASQDNQLQESSENNAEAQASSVITTRENIPDYEGYAYITINDNNRIFRMRTNKELMHLKNIVSWIPWEDVVLHMRISAKNCSRQSHAERSER